MTVYVAYDTRITVMSIKRPSILMKQGNVIQRISDIGWNVEKRCAHKCD